MTKKFKILRAMLRGDKITPLDANRIGRTTEGGRYIRLIRVTHPVIKERIEGTKYYRYYLDPEYVREYRAKNRAFRCWENIKGLFR